MSLWRRFGRDGGYSQNTKGAEMRDGASMPWGPFRPRPLFPASLLRPYPSHRAAGEPDRASFCRSSELAPVGPARPAHRALTRGRGHLLSMRTAGRPTEARGGPSRPVKEEARYDRLCELPGGGGAGTEAGEPGGLWTRDTGRGLPGHRQGASVQGEKSKPQAAEGKVGLVSCAWWGERNRGREG